MDDYNASNSRSIKRLAKIAKLADAQRREVVFSLMSTPGGRDWVWDLLNRCHIFSSTFSTDPYASAFNEGNRNIGLWLLADVMRAAPDQYIQMTREANDRHIAADRGSLGDRPDSGRDDSGRADDTRVASEYDPATYDYRGGAAGEDPAD